MAHWFQLMDQQVGVLVVFSYSFVLICFSFSLDGEDSDLSRAASRICSPIRSEEEMVSEDMTDMTDETSDLSKYFLVVSSVCGLCPNLASSQVVMVGGRLALTLSTSLMVL